MQRLSLLFFIFFLVSVDLSFAQDSLKTAEINSEKIDSSFHFLKLNLESRTFFMSTINEGSFKDDYALATTLALGFTTKRYHGFQFDFGVYYNFHLNSSNLTSPDPVSGGSNRYESGLFNLTNQGSYNKMAQIEIINLQYHTNNHSVKIGRFKLDNPFVNPQDGRMRPTFEEGAWLNLFQNNKIKFNGGVITRILVRGTNNWNKPGTTLGIFPSGLNQDGSKSDYTGNIKSNYIAIANFDMKLSDKVKLYLWDGFIDNVQNTIVAEIKHENNLKAHGLNMYKGIMFIHQDAINDGGNSDPSKTYFTKGSQSNVISAQVGVKNKRVNTSINYTHITGDGRYTMPREWGKEIFYTFLPRERNEGAGNVHAFMVKALLTSKNSRFKNTIGYGYYKMPDISDSRLNKYLFPAYHQLNYDMRFLFSNFLKGLELHSLVVYKINAGETYNNSKAVYNKVDMVNLNFIVTYAF